MEIKLIDANGTKLLQRNGQVLNCPFQQPLILPGAKSNVVSMQQQPEFQVVPTPCGTWCPKFSLHHYNDGETIYLQCGSETTKYNTAKNKLDA
ncbi:MAG TPA: hypothetical protein PLO59_00060 [Bacteroidia bacterium]|nr:hypothetical protein [Bacteroidia bacterium]